MEKRLYFILGDLLAVTTVGGGIGLVMVLVIPTGWNMLVAMAIGMALGMALSLPPSFFFMGRFGAMEVLAPTMLAGMLSGMWVAMAEAMRPLGWLEGLGAGVAIGLLSFVVTYALNAWIRRDADRRDLDMGLL